MKPEKPKPKPKGGEPTREDLDVLHRVVGEVAMFLGESKRHRHMFMSELQWLVLPAVLLRKYKLVRNGDGRTVGYMSWAEVSEELQERMLSGEVRLKPSEWKSGNQAVVVQLVCSPEVEERMLGALKAEVFSERSLRVVVHGPGGKPELREVVAAKPSEEGAPSAGNAPSLQ